jgi:hypothetical protein
MRRSASRGDPSKAGLSGVEPGAAGSTMAAAMAAAAAAAAAASPTGPPTSPPTPPVGSETKRTRATPGAPPLVRSSSSCGAAVPDSWRCSERPPAAPTAESIVAEEGGRLRESRPM